MGLGAKSGARHGLSAVLPPDPKASEAVFNIWRRNPRDYGIYTASHLNRLSARGGFPLTAKGDSLLGLAGTGRPLMSGRPEMSEAPSSSDLRMGARHRGKGVGRGAAYAIANASDSEDRAEAARLAVHPRAPHVLTLFPQSGRDRRRTGAPSIPSLPALDSEGLFHGRGGIIPITRMVARERFKDMILIRRD